MIVQADSTQLICLKALLHNFVESTGVKVNYRESNMLPINVPDEILTHFSNTLSCQKGISLFTYRSWIAQKNSFRKTFATKYSLVHFNDIW